MGSTTLDISSRIRDLHVYWKIYHNFNNIAIQENMSEFSVLSRNFEKKENNTSMNLESIHENCGLRLTASGDTTRFLCKF